MSRKHKSDPTDHPTHPVKEPTEVNQGPIQEHNGTIAGGESTKDRMVEIGRGENIPGRQPQG